MSAAPILSALKNDKASLSVVHASVSAKVQYGLATLRMDFNIISFNVCSGSP